MSLDSKFFRKAKKHGLELTETQGIVPAPTEIRVNLPNYRLRTPEERRAVLETKFDEIKQLEEQIETQRKELLELVTAYREHTSGISEIYGKNEAIQRLLEKRSDTLYAVKWLEEKESVELHEIFETKRPLGKLKTPLFQVKRRTEPLQTLYVTMEESKLESEISEKAAKEEEAEKVMEEEKEVAKSESLAKSTGPKVTSAREGAIIGTAKRVFKLKKSGAVGGGAT
jgi:hypothetical protein